MPLLTLENLSTHLCTSKGILKAVDNVSFFLTKGETLGLVGESGCGKTMLALSILRLVPDPPAKIVSGRILYQLTNEGAPVDLLSLNEKQMRKVRGRRIAMIFQEPMNSLNPVFTIGDQIGEAIKLHVGGTNKEVREKVIDILKLVQMPAPERRFYEYPHQLSGGMRQRVMIAMALACRPDLLIADEPTTALDVTIQAEILELMMNLGKKFGMATILITHDFGIIASAATRVIVMYAGRFVEEGATKDIFAHPMHPYTKGLLDSIPRLHKTQERLTTIGGQVPDLTSLPHACTFHNRCPKVQDKCRIIEPPLEQKDGRLVRCYYPY